MVIKESHPFVKMAGFFIERDAVFQFSKYTYQADSILDSRSVLEINSKDITFYKVIEWMQALAENEEIALHSVFFVKSKIGGRQKRFHIPMIDFSCSEFSVELMDRLEGILPRKIFNDLLIFKSGRSFHGYSLHPVSEREWVSFMGRLLLINLPNGVKYIDDRWIGHRLMARYSSLRWSNNTHYHLEQPSFLGSVADIRNML